MQVESLTLNRTYILRLSGIKDPIIKGFGAILMLRVCFVQKGLTEWRVLGLRVWMPLSVRRSEFVFFTKPVLSGKPLFRFVSLSSLPLSQV